VRIDSPFDQAYPTNTLAVVEVLTSQTEAEFRSFSLESTQRCKGLLVAVYFLLVQRRVAAL
jgi:hypothetical protein